MLKVPLLPMILQAENHLIHKWINKLSEFNPIINVIQQIEK